MEFASDRRQGVSASGYGRTGGHSEYEGRFSDDGRWLTYFSYETRKAGSLRGAISGGGFETPGFDDGRVASEVQPQRVVL